MNLSPAQISVIKEVLTDHPTWEFNNFGEQEPIKPLLGMQEEIGELSQAVLKHSQGIRSGTEEEVKDKIRDAIGDVVVYLISFCNKANVGLLQVIADTDKYMIRLLNDMGLPDSENIRKDRMALPMWSGFCLQKLWKGHVERDYSLVLTGVAGLLKTLYNTAIACLDERISDCVKRAWDEVKARDWKYNPWNGQTNLPLT
jgi:NTP pyrophosphatase (non-canonical NTP hydrolase)